MAAQTRVVEETVAKLAATSDQSDDFVSRFLALLKNVPAGAYRDEHVERLIELLVLKESHGP